MAPSVMVPLYIYPSAGAWEPLYQAAANHPDLSFTVVVNPHSGPGATALPDANYTNEIPRLNAFGNVRTLGYVATNYATKNLDDVLAEVTQYAAWASADSTLQLDGVFFDETPTGYTDAIDGYLRTISTAVQETAGLGLTEGFVVLNPGSLPDVRLLSHADQTVVFESPYSSWSNLTLAQRIEDMDYSRQSLISLVHSIPNETKVDTNNLHCMIKHLQLLTSGIFLTDLDDAYYANWSDRWHQFVDLLA